MNISRFVHKRMVGIAPAATLREAAKAMRISHLSCLAVLRGETVVGLITERDLVKAMALSDRPGNGFVAHHMNDFVTASREDEIPHAVAKMLAAGCIDLPVVEHGNLVGVVSAPELLAAEARLQRIPV